MASRPTKKRRTDYRASNAESAAREITNARELQNIMSDYSGAGLKSFKDFLNRCSKGPEVDEPTAKTNRAILKDYLEAQCRHTAKEGEGEAVEGEKEVTAFGDVAQMWGYANQNNSISTLSLVPATMAILVRLCSYHDELNAFGATLVKSLLRQTTLKVIYRGLSGSKDNVVSPCLRLLTEMNRFNFGAMCGFVHSSFDFTIKDLPRNLEVKRADKAVVEDPARPSVRTLFVRFFLSFLLYGEPSVRNEMLGLRGWITPIFKHLKMDTPTIIQDLLECMTTRVLDEKDIPRATKTNVFNEWILSHILGLYTREEMVKVSKAGKEEEKRTADLAHEFLLSACTNRGSGVCFPDHGWYPPGYTGDEDKRKSAPKVYNRILSSFLPSIRPYADTMQLDLMLEIFKTCPELVADHFLSNSSLSFDPKLTSTWIGYCTFLLSTIALPIPANFGALEVQAQPPPANVIVENILPKPLTKVVVTKCLTHENSLIRFFTTRLLITAFQKLRSVLTTLETAESAVHDPTEAWKKCKFDVIEEFCKRIPDATVVSSIGSGKTDTNGVLQTEAKMRLLADYYATIPEMALSSKFDVNVALSNFLGDEGEGQKGMKLLGMGHLLKIANEVPDVKWWNKTPALKHSPFVAILKRCRNSTTNSPQQQIRALLHSFSSSSYLFQAETSASPLDALLESLSTVENSEDLEAILSLLDEVVARCIRGPFKYLDEYAEILQEIQKTAPDASNLPPVSPVIMTLVDQWKFFMQSKDHSASQKLSGVRWLLRFMESCALLGENRCVLAVLCDKVLANSSAIKGVLGLKTHLQKDQSLKLASDDGRGEDAVVGIRDLFTRLPARCVDIQIVPLLSQGVLHRRIEASVFDLAVVQRAIADIVMSKKISAADAISAVVALNELMKYVAFQLMGQGEKVVEKTKALVIQEGACFQLFLSASVSADRIPLVVEFSHGYAELFSAVFEKNDPVLETARETILSKTPRFVDVFETLSENDTPKILFIYRTMISLFYASDDVNGLVKRLSSSKALPKDGILSQLFAFILHLSAERGDIIDVDFINRLLKADTMAPRVSSALVAYISGTKAGDLLGITYPKATTAEQMVVVCSLIPKLGDVRDAALKQLSKELRAGGKAQMLSERISALLEAYSEAEEDLTQFVWAVHASGDVRAKLEEVFSVAQSELLQVPPDAAQVNVFCQAASLFPSLDRDRVLKHIATDRKRSLLTENMVALMGALVGDSVGVVALAMKGWFLMVFDHLTRRFAEDAVLTTKTTGLARALGKFLSGKAITLESVVPRVALNAVLEAGLQKHISVPEVVYLSAAIASQSSPKSLDLAKLLQVVLGHGENTLSHRGTIYKPEAVHHYTVFLILKLFLAGKTTLCNTATLDGVMALYRGTNDHIDSIFLRIITQIEGYLARSCASRISSWAVVESTERPLITRVRGRLEVTINAKMLARSVFNFVPHSTRDDYETLDTYLTAVQDDVAATGKAYDPRFLLPALSFCLVAPSHILEAQAAIERNCVGFAMSSLSSEDAGIRQMASGFLGAVVSKLEESPYRNKTQVSHLLLSVLASLSGGKEPLPCATSIFLAQTTLVLVAPTHFLYEKTMELLLRHPLLQLHDLPLMLSTQHIAGDENHHKEVAWILNTLTAGIKTQRDLDLYRKRNVFGNVLALYASPNSTERAKEKVLELLWNVAAVEGGATTLLTRNGAVAWIEAMVGGGGNEDLMLRRLAARMWEGSRKGHVKEWSRGTFSARWGEGGVLRG